MKKKECYSLDAEVGAGIKRQAEAEGHRNKSLVANRLLKRGLVAAGRESVGLKSPGTALASIEARLSALETAMRDSNEAFPSRSIGGDSFIGAALRKVIGSRRDEGKLPERSDAQR